MNQFCATCEFHDLCEKLEIKLKAKLAPLEEEARKREDYLTRLEAIPVRKESDQKIKVAGGKVRYVGLCKLCFSVVTYEDHKICRKCRTRISRDKEMQKMHKQMLEKRMMTTGAEPVDSAIRTYFPIPKEI